MTKAKRKKPPAIRAPEDIVLDYLRGVVDFKRGIGEVMDKDREGGNRATGPQIAHMTEIHMDELQPILRKLAAEERISFDKIGDLVFWEFESYTPAASPTRGGGVHLQVHKEVGEWVIDHPLTRVYVWDLAIEPAREEALRQAARDRAEEVAHA